MTVEDLIKENVCVICSKTFYGFGNNPAPIKFSGKCCNDCDSLVIKARLEKIMTRCIDCGESPLFFEGENEYEPDPITGDKRCWPCDIKANPERYDYD